ncbi:MAG: hypothetical protein ACI81V_001511, partial [Lentimonas sp.]
RDHCHRFCSERVYPAISLGGSRLLRMRGGTQLRYLEAADHRLDSRCYFTRGCRDHCHRFCSERVYPAISLGGSRLLRMRGGTQLRYLKTADHRLDSRCYLTRGWRDHCHRFCSERVYPAIPLGASRLLRMRGGAQLRYLEALQPMRPAS